jgi:hypothetical protein
VNIHLQSSLITPVITIQNNKLKTTQITCKISHKVINKSLTINFFKYIKEQDVYKICILNKNNNTYCPSLCIVQSKDSSSIINSENWTWARLASYILSLSKSRKIEKLLLSESNSEYYFVKLQSINFRMMDIWEDKTLTSQKFKNGLGITVNKNYCNFGLETGVIHRNKNVWIDNHEVFDQLLAKNGLFKLTPEAREIARQRANDFAKFPNHV